MSWSVKPIARRRSRRLSKWRDAFAVVEIPHEMMLRAAGLVSDHQLAIWDAVPICAAAEAGYAVSSSTPGIRLALRSNVIIGTRLAEPH